MPSMALAAAPRDWEITTRNSANSADVSENLTPNAYDLGSYSMPMFVGGGGTSGTYISTNIGSGFAIAGSNISVTPYSIETTDGHLSDTLSIMQTQISGLGTQFDWNAFFVGNATSTNFLASSTTNGFISSADKAKLDSLSTTSPLKSYEGTTLRSGSFPIFKSVSVSSGTAVVNLTADGTSGGTALCTNGVIQDSVSVIFNDASSSFQQGWAFSNSNKTLTVTANKFTSANILSGILGQAAANGSTAKISVWCY